ncbi:DUF1611 domain-containing protein [Oceanobacillus piezotolerans]|uniref:DUF1611 domain-containing protein n=1 Tax=Oceanobacillus piezotolerans TaxID=2448030 RepID=A0A498DU45_9BACI|nr:DUF1611 domain-containing protein [Oceanobacillus piezotolerans]RLL48377.1 DUF1611 domain-containing protein [Oceanobacillus piezotolerans]
MSKHAVVYCEYQFGSMDGKTANGLVREPGKYNIVGIIDSTKAGLDAGEYLDSKKSGIPVFKNLDEALRKAANRPEDFIIGLAPADAFLNDEERQVVIKAMEEGLNIINPLQEFLTEDEEIMTFAKQYNVEVRDIRKPKPKKDWHIFTGRILDIETPIITVLGTDGACGKRTTAVILDKELQARGYKTAFISTGQTGLIQGYKYGFAIDAFPMQYLIGEIENEIVRAEEIEKPDIIIVEGQGALSHPGYASSAGILKGAKPKAVILQHPPKRKVLGDFPFMPMPKVEDEINLIEHYAQTKVIGITLNHEGMTDEDIESTITDYENQYKLPVTDVLKFGPAKIVDNLIAFFPSLSRSEQVGVSE